MIDLLTLKNSEDVRYSHSDVMLLRSQHGDVVAISHVVTKNNLQSTNIFFFDGFIHTLDNLHIGVLEEGNYKNYLMLLTLIKEMPLMFDVLSESSITFLMDIYIEHENDLENKTLIFVFKPPYHTLPEDHIVNYCRGIKTIDESISLLYVEDNNKIIEVFNYSSGEEL